MRKSKRVNIMITNAKKLDLVAIYLFICDLYEKELKYVCQRFSNNCNPDFTDQEIITIYLFVMLTERKFEIKQIHKYTDEYLRSWFPLLPSYVAFNTRLNRLSEPFKILIEIILNNFVPSDCSKEISLLDSLPIITCSGKRKAKVAREITDKSYCSTKSMWYYGLKLHILASRRPGTLPFPEQILFTPASENDLNLYKQAWSEIQNRNFFGDKIYIDATFFDAVFKNFNSIMFTPVKEIKNQSDAIKKRDKAANDLFSKAVSKIRQPIESLFNWLITKTDIQRASRVRSTKGLMVHAFGRIAAAFIYLIFNS